MLAIGELEEVNDEREFFEQQSIAEPCSQYMQLFPFRCGLVSLYHNAYDCIVAPLVPSYRGSIAGGFSVLVSQSSVALIQLDQIFGYLSSNNIHVLSVCVLLEFHFDGKSQFLSMYFDVVDNLLLADGVEAAIVGIS